MCTVHINKQILRARIFTFLVFFTLSYQKTVLKTHTDIKTHTDNHISPLIHFIFYSSTFL